MWWHLLQNHAIFNQKPFSAIYFLMGSPQVDVTQITISSGVLQRVCGSFSAIERLSENGNAQVISRMERRGLSQKDSCKPPVKSPSGDGWERRESYPLVSRCPVPNPSLTQTGTVGEIRVLLQCRKGDMSCLKLGRRETICKIILCLCTELNRQGEVCWNGTQITFLKATPQIPEWLFPVMSPAVGRKNFHFSLLWMHLDPHLV